MSNARFGFRTRSGQISSIIQSQFLDSDAATFIIAAGITDTTQISAINTLVVSLKNNLLWTKFKAIYPIVGGTSTSHKYNLKDPQDTNAAFRLTFIGGLTHSNGGILSNGSNGYCDTNLTINTNLSLNDAHISFYSRTNVAQNGYDVGNGTLSGAEITLVTRFGNGLAYFGLNNTAINIGTNSDSTGYYIGSRTASNALALYRNNSTFYSSTLASNSLSSNTLKLLSYDGTQAFSTKQMVFATIGTSFTSGEASTLYTIVQTYQTTLNRQV